MWCSGHCLQGLVRSTFERGNFLIELLIISSVALVSGAQQSDSVIHTHMFSFEFFFIIGGGVHYPS